MHLTDDFKKIIESENITTVFQPIVSLENGEIIGYEALSRGPINSSLYSPLKLIEIAKIENMIWELEFLFRKKAIEKAGNMNKEKFLFLNVDPKVIKDSKFKKGLTKQFLKKNGICPKNIIMELTERTYIEDYKSFMSMLKNYTDQGYKVALDDMGSGYSGLKSLAEIKPNYIKIDMDLIRDIDKIYLKQIIVDALVHISQKTSIKLIAEGIETEKELKTLINLGVSSGQGYFIERPSEQFKEIPQKIKDIIFEVKKHKGNIIERFEHDKNKVKIS